MYYRVQIFHALSHAEALDRSRGRSLWPALGDSLLRCLLVRLLASVILFLQGVIPSLLGRAFEGVGIAGQSRDSDREARGGGTNFGGLCRGFVWGGSLGGHFLSITHLFVCHEYKYSLQR